MGKRGSACVQVLCWALLTSSASLAFPTQDDNTPGSMAMAYRRQSNIWSRFDCGFVDAKETSSPPNSVKYDRRLEILGILGFDIAISPRFGLRVNAKTDMVKRRQAELEAPKTVVDEQIQTYSPSIDATFITDKGLEIFAGGMYRVIPAYEQAIVAGSAESKTKFGKGALLDRRFGLVRRAGVWNGGISYSLGVENKRRFEKSASDGSKLTGEEKIFVPSRFSLFGEVNAGMTTWDFEMAFVQARGKGPINETGSSLFTDYFEARFGSFFSFGSGFGLKLSVAHQTFSYASNDFVTIDTIPLTSFKTLMLFGEPASHAFLGLIVAQGKDGQSLPEFNSKYDFKAAALTSGFIFPL